MFFIFYSFAFIKFATRKEAMAALSKADGMLFKDKEIHACYRKKSTEEDSQTGKSETVTEQPEKSHSQTVEELEEGELTEATRSGIKQSEEVNTLSEEYKKPVSRSEEPSKLSTQSTVSKELTHVTDHSDTSKQPSGPSNVPSDQPNLKSQSADELERLQIPANMSKNSQSQSVDNVTAGKLDNTVKNRELQGNVDKPTSKSGQIDSSVEEINKSGMNFVFIYPDNVLKNLLILLKLNII